MAVMLSILLQKQDQNSLPDTTFMFYWRAKADECIFGELWIVRLCFMQGMVYVKFAGWQ